MDSQKSPLIQQPSLFLLPSPPQSPPSPPVHRPPSFLLPPSPTSPLQPQQTSPTAHNPPPFLLPPPPPSPLQPHQKSSPPTHHPPPFLLPTPPPPSPPQPHQKSPPAHHPPPFLLPPPSSPPPFLLPPPSSAPQPHQKSPLAHHPPSPPSPPQPHQKSPPVHHPSLFLRPPLTPPPPQPHQQEQPNSYILPTNAIFQQPHQQNNLQLPFNSVSWQNSKLNFVDHSDGSSVVVAGAEVGAKKKRGRPRKYLVDAKNGLGLSSTPIAQTMVNHVDSGVVTAGGGVNWAASSENPAKKGCGRPPGSGKKRKLKASDAAGSEFTPHFIHVHTGEDIVHKVMAFSLQGPPATCVLSATGVVSNVTLQQTTIGGGTMMYEGRFNIISLSGSFLVSESNGYRSRTGNLSVTLCGTDGGVLGGVVDGILKAASPVLLVMGSFIPPKKEPMPEAPSSTPPPNMSNVDASSNSANENGGSPLNQRTGAEQCEKASFD